MTKASLFCVLLPLAMAPAVASTTGDALPNRPDILLILIDDLGCRDLACEGHATHRTPNIDALRAGSIRFRHAGCNGPNCSPSRAALVTARHGSRTDVHTVGNADRGKTADRRVKAPKNGYRIREEEQTIAETLGAAGYRTGFVGKWHVSDDPTTQGFDRNVAGNKAGHPKSYFSPYRNADLKDGPKGEYLVDRLASETVAMIKSFESASEEDGRPWFVMYAPYAVHTPIQASAEAVAAMKARHPGMTDRSARYAVMVEATDRAVGSILAAVDAERTVVCFASDNGGLQPVTDMSPWRGGKGMLYEGGVRTPLFIRAPGLSARDVETPVQLFDVHPTLVELAGAAMPVDRPIDAVSLVPALRGNSLDRGPLFWHFPAYLEGRDAESHEPGRPFRTTPCGSIREGRWKLIEWFEDGDVELFDLETDPGELLDRSETEPELRDAMLGRLAAWRLRMKSAMPTPLPVVPSSPDSN
ncbi:MAG: sulfatase [Phycisphaerales bacterium]|jgi:arylsulfatase A-like enzyme|nr:sulfatase [Phycisphaerales bacterium]